MEELYIINYHLSYKGLMKFRIYNGIVKSMNQNYIFPLFILNSFNYLVNLFIYHFTNYLKESILLIQILNNFQ